MVVGEPASERRHSLRVSLALPCVLLPAPTKAPGPFVGVTENVSRGGLLIRWRRAEPAVAMPQVGDWLTLALEWPCGARFGQRYLRCSGRVVRVSLATGEEPRVAIEVHQMRFCGFGDREPVVGEG